MVNCSNPACINNNDARNDTMHMEYCDETEVWIPVCDTHLMESRHSIEIAHCVGSIPAETLTHIKNELVDSS